MHTDLSTQTQSFIVGLDSVRAFGRVHIFSKNFDDKVQDFVAAYLTMGTVERWVNAAVIAPLTGVFMTIMTCVLVAMRDSSMVSPESAGLVLSYLSVLACVHVCARVCFCLVGDPDHESTDSLGWLHAWCEQHTHTHAHARRFLACGYQLPFLFRQSLSNCCIQLSG